MIITKEKIEEIKLLNYEGLEYEEIDTIIYSHEELRNENEELRKENFKLKHEKIIEQKTF